MKRSTKRTPRRENRTDLSLSFYRSLSYVSPSLHSLSIKLTHIRSAGNESSSASLRHTEHLFERREDDTRLSCEFRFEVVHSPTRWGGRRGGGGRRGKNERGGGVERKEKKKKEKRRKRNEKGEERWAGTDGRGEKKKRELLEQ